MFGEQKNRVLAQLRRGGADEELLGWVRQRKKPEVKPQLHQRLDELLAQCGAPLRNLASRVPDFTRRVATERNGMSHNSPKEGGLHLWEIPPAKALLQMMLTDLLCIDVGLPTPAWGTDGVGGSRLRAATAWAEEWESRTKA